jgi:hypothetical protein
MKPTVLGSVSRDELWTRLPDPVKRQIKSSDLPASGYYISFGIDNKDVVRHGDAARAIGEVRSDVPIVVVGPNFTQEALAVLKERGSLILSLGDYFWTESSLDSVR